MCGQAALLEIDGTKKRRACGRVEYPFEFWVLPSRSSKLIIALRADFLQVPGNLPAISNTQSGSLRVETLRSPSDQV